jgi:hypothetical protein
MIFIKVVGPVGRDVYINRSYDAPIGTTVLTFDVESAPTLIETLNAADQIDFRGKVEHAAPGAMVTITLKAVVPPEAKGA